MQQKGRASEQHPTRSGWEARNARTLLTVPPQAQNAVADGFRPFL
jgi:hypothetical protein